MIKIINKWRQYLKEEKEISSKDELKKQINKYPIERINERIIGNYNLELLEKPRRRIDAISRPTATERARVVRYTHSE